MRLHVFASTAPINGPESAGQALTLKQAACVVVSPGAVESAVVELDALLAKVESRPKRPPVFAFVGQKPQSLPKDWTALVAPSAGAAVEAGVRKVTDLIK